MEDDRDNCPGTTNPLQFDVDGDSEGDRCEHPFILSDDFVGTDGTDLAFGDFGDSVLFGGAGRDSLYGGVGADVLDGGMGLDALVGGPGDDRITGGSECDVFAIETGLLHRDVFTDFDPVVDRVRFPPVGRTKETDQFPMISRGGSEHLEVHFVVRQGPAATVVFRGIAPDAPIVLSTDPCGQGPPPPSICPSRGAFQRFVSVGLEDRFCPGDGELHVNTGVYATARYGVDAGKEFGRRGREPRS